MQDPRHHASLRGVFRRRAEDLLDAVAGGDDAAIHDENPFALSPPDRLILGSFRRMRSVKRVGFVSAFGHGISDAPGALSILAPHPSPVLRFETLS